MSIDHKDYGALIRELTRMKRSLVEAWEQHTDARTLTREDDQYDALKRGERANVDAALGRGQDVVTKLRNLADHIETERETGPPPERPDLEPVEGGDDGE